MNRLLRLAMAPPGRRLCSCSHPLWKVTMPDIQPTDDQFAEARRLGIRFRPGVSQFELTQLIAEAQAAAIGATPNAIFNLTRLGWVKIKRVHRDGTITVGIRDLKGRYNRTGRISLRELTSAMRVG